VDPGLLVIVVGVPATGFVFGLWMWFRDDARRSRRVLRRTRVSAIADLVDGKLACVVGTIEPEGAAQLTSMAAHRTCVAYDTTVYFFPDGDATIPKRVEVERRLVPCFVTDGTGRIRVDAGEAALCNRPVARSDRFEERIIEAGAKVRIVGSVVLEPVLDGNEHAYREGGTTATLTGTAAWPILIDLER
jgi:hypothetical protein